MNGQELPAGISFGPQVAASQAAANQTADHEVAAIAKALRQKARQMALVGLLWFAGGLAISVGSYVAAEPGETYHVFWGAALFGAYKLIRGLYYMADPGKLLPAR